MTSYSNLKMHILHHFSVVWEETWSLIGKWSSFTSIISGAPSTSLAESGSSALPRLRALLGTLPVVGFRDGAVLVVWVSSSSVYQEAFYPISEEQLDLI